MKKTIISGIAAAFIFTTGAAAAGILEDFKTEKKNDIEMRFSQMESKAVAYNQTKIEDFRMKDMERIEKEIEKYMEKKLPETGGVIDNLLADVEYKRQTQQIKKEHDAVIAELKQYIDNVSEKYKSGYEN